MVKIAEPNFNVGIAKIPLGYAEASAPNLQPIAAGLADMGQAFARVEAEQKAKADTMKRYNALSSFQDFETNSKLKLQQTLDGADPSDTSTAQKAIDNQIAYENEFIKTLPPDLQPEFKVRADSVRGGITLDAHASQDKMNNAYYKNDINETQNTATVDINKDPSAMEKWKSDLYTKIDNSGLSESEKYFAKQNADRVLETAGYGATVKQEKLSAAQYTNDLATAATQASRQLGISPVDLLTVISYETGGTFNVNQKGGAGGRYKGLIQFGPEEQKKYGIHDGMSVGEQMGAVVQFLQDRGFKPGMTIYDLYSTINAGSPGHYNASDAHNGGAPGTVADKVRTQMDGHRQKAEALLGGKFEVPSTIDSDPRFQNVLYEDRIALQNDATTAVNRELASMAAERKAQQEAQFNDLMLGINDNRYGMKDIEAAREQGWLSDYDQVKKAQDLVEQKNKDGADLANFMTRVERGDTLDPTDSENKKGMGLWFQNDGGEAKLQSMDQNYITGSLGPTFRATGMLPPDAVGILNTMTRSADGRKVFYAYKALNDLEEMNPDAYTAQVPEAVRNKADVYDALRFTTPEPELIGMLRDNPSAEERRARIDRKEQAKKELDSPDNTKVNFQSVIDHFGADQAEVGIKATVMENEWRSLLLENAAKGLSLEQANEAALVQLGRKWGNFEFDGTTTLMRNPPDKFYPAVAKSHQWITDQARGELGLMPGEKLQLVSDARTEADIAAGRPPTYIPMIQRENGLWEPATRLPTPTPTSAAAMHDVAPMTDTNPIVQRMYFRPTEEDKSLHDKQSVVDSYDARIRELTRTLPAVRTGHVAPPGAIQETLAKLQQGRAAAVEALNGSKTQAEQQYMTSAQQQLQEAQKSFAPLQAEMQTWTDPIEQWPKVHEWEKLYDKIEQLKAQVRNEVGAKRASHGVQ